mgnify:CR=1 FL=1
MRSWTSESARYASPETFLRPNAVSISRRNFTAASLGSLRAAGIDGATDSKAYHALKRFLSAVDAG